MSWVKAGLAWTIARAVAAASQITSAWVDSDATRDMSASRRAPSWGERGDFSGEAGTEDFGDEGEADESFNC